MSGPTGHAMAGDAPVGCAEILAQPPVLTNPVHGQTGTQVEATEVHMIEKEMALFRRRLAYWAERQHKP
jgi:hypothetical protein